MPLLEEKGRRLRGLLNMVLYAAVTAVLTLVLATALSGQSKELADRVDRNSVIARSGVDTIMCVLLTDPTARNAKTISTCAAEHGYTQYYTP